MIFFYCMYKFLFYDIYIYGRALENLVKVNNPCQAQLAANNLGNLPNMGS